MSPVADKYRDFLRKTATTVTKVLLHAWSLDRLEGPWRTPAANTPGLLVARTLDNLEWSDLQTPAAESFYGDWRVHGGGATFLPDGTGHEFGHVGFTDKNDWLNEEADLKTQLTDGGRKLVVTITDVYFTVNGVRSPNSVSEYPPDSPSATLSSSHLNTRS